MKINAEIYGISPEQAEEVKDRLKRLVDGLIDERVCQSHNADRTLRCEFEAWHDGPTCRNNGVTWYNTLVGNVPPPRIRRTEVGAHLVRRSDEVLFEIVEITEEFARLVNLVGDVIYFQHNNGQSLWAMFYANPRKAVAPVARIWEGER